MLFYKNAFLIPKTKDSLMSETLFSVEFVTSSNVVGVNGGIGRATKKVRRHTDQPPGLHDPTGDGNGQSITRESNKGISYKDPLVGGDDRGSEWEDVDEDF